MKIAVWDTCVPRSDNGHTMHFDILVPDGTPFPEVQRYGREYLATKGQCGQPLTTSECQYCHSESASASAETDIRASGYAIIEMENC
ncbi:MAG: hypothetical protein COV99_05415 [Bacteroidetes bacterium CG12_big_fil_rev_8_21_14_0_65_60_17]|nr:MAG: hypothetical protein COV99_05415 [Bacteroidetes bacterium CG12_big_fil_rev_8_21_14_0_65_60_17]